MNVDHYTRGREIWLPVVTKFGSYADFYEVSSFGSIRTVGRTFVRKDKKPYTLKPKLRKLPKTSAGYPMVRLCNKGDKNFFKFKRGRIFLVHRLVAWAFLPNKNPQILTEVNHKDGNKENNFVGNLEWVTPSQNRIHSYANGFQKPKTKPIFQLTSDGRIIRKWSGMTEAAKYFGTPVSCISRVCNGSRNKAAGFCWRFCNEC